MKNLSCLSLSLEKLFSSRPAHFLQQTLEFLWLISSCWACGTILTCLSFPPSYSSVWKAYWSSLIFISFYFTNVTSFMINDLLVWRQRQCDLCSHIKILILEILYLSSAQNKIYSSYPHLYNTDSVDVRTAVYQFPGFKHLPQYHCTEALDTFDRNLWKLC